MQLHASDRLLLKHRALHNPRRLLALPKHRELVSVAVSPRHRVTISQTEHGGLANASTDSDLELKDYNEERAADIIATRLPIQAIFLIGLIIAAGVIERFQDVLEKHVELSFFLPLIMGHGGNSGSQTVSELIRALALRQVRWKRGLPVIVKEAAAGGVMGGVLGLVIYVLSLFWDHLSSEVGLTVAIALPLVSMWSTSLAAFTTLASNKLKLDPAMTSGPLVATLVDTTGIIIYFQVAQAVMSASLDASVQASSTLVCGVDTIC